MFVVLHTLYTCAFFLMLYDLLSTKKFTLESRVSFRAVADDYF